MPHKHKRKRDEDTSNFDLDPSVEVKPLPAYKPPSVFSTDTSNKRRKRTANDNAGTKDDTPKAFARMMAWQKYGKRPSGLDDGTVTKSTAKQKPKGRKVPGVHGNEAAASEDVAADPAVTENSGLAGNFIPQILPGESLSQFALRVDQSLPLASIAKSSTNPNIPSDIKPKARITKHNKRLQKMITDWRDTDAKLKEKQEEEEEDLEEKREEEDLLWDKVKAVGTIRKGKKKAAKSKGAADDNPWKDLDKKRRAETKQKGLQDVVKAPPTLIKVKSKFKMRDADFQGTDGKQYSELDGDVGVDVKDVPNAVGSLRRREEIGARRREVIEGYRKLKGRRLKGTGLSHPLPKSILT